MRKIYIHAVAVCALLMIGCSGSVDWPPPLSSDVDDSWADRTLRDLPDASVSGTFDDWQHIKDAQGKILGMGFDMTDGKCLVPVNIFIIDSVPDVRIENLFVVEDYGADYTLITIEKSKSHRLCMSYNGISSEGLQIETTAIFPGTRAQVGDNVYELKPDGWYLGDKLMHSVTAVPPSQ